MLAFNAEGATTTDDVYRAIDPVFGGGVVQIEERVRVDHQTGARHKRFHVFIDMGRQCGPLVRLLNAFDAEGAVPVPDGRGGVWMVRPVPELRLRAGAVSRDNAPP